MSSDKPSAELLVTPSTSVSPTISSGSTIASSEKNPNSKDACFAKLFASTFCWSPDKILAFLYDWSKYYSEVRPASNTRQTEEDKSLFPEELTFLRFHAESMKGHNKEESLKLLHDLRDIFIKPGSNDKSAHQEELKVESSHQEEHKQKFEYTPEHRKKVREMIKMHPHLITSLVKSFGMHSMFEPHFRSYHYNDLAIIFDDFVTGLINACTENIKEGGLIARLAGHSERGECDPFTIEFREISTDLIEKMLDGNHVSIITVSRNILKLRWYGSSWDPVYIFDKTSSNSENFPHNWDGMKMVFSQDSIGVEEILTRDMLYYGHVPKKKILVFCGEGKTAYKYTVHKIQAKLYKLHLYKFIEYPLKYSELSFSDHTSVLDHLTLVVQRKRRYRLGDVFKSAEELHHFFVALGEEVANNLIQHGELNILQWQCPKEPKNYIEGTLFDRSTFTAEMLIQTGQSEIFCILGNSVNIPEVLQTEITKLEDTNIPEINSAFQQSNKFILIEEDYEVFRTKFDKAVEYVPYSVNVHVLSYVSGNKFKWLRTYGSVLGIQLTHDIELPETQFLEELEVFKIQNSEKICVISDIFGMGKTSFLASVAKMISMSNRIIVYFNANKFVSQIWQHRKTLKVDDIFQVVIKAITANEPDKIFLQFVIDQKTCFEINVLLDDLDSVNLDSQRLALKAIKILSEIPSVFVWLTCRTTCLDLIARELGCLGYGLSAFSDTCKTEYFDSLVKSEGSSNLNEIRLNEYKSKLIELSIARIPLCCNVACRKFLQLASIENHSKNFDNFLEIYEEIINERLCKFLTRSSSLDLKSVSELEKTSRVITNMKIWHLHHAIKFLFDTSLENDNRVPGWLLFTPDDFDKKVLEIGLVETINPTSFCDQSIAEYIVAYFIAREYTQGTAAFTRIILKEALSLKKTSKLDNRFKFPFLCKALNLLFLTNKRKNQTKCMNNTVLNTVKYLQSKYPLILKTYAPTVSTAFKNGHTGLVYFMHHYDKYITELWQTSLVCCHLRFLKYAFEEIPCLKPDRWCKHQEIDEKNRSLLHWLVIGFFHVPLATERKRLFEFIVNEIKKEEEEKEEVVEKKKKKVVVEKKSENKKKKCKIRNLLESKDENGQTPLLLLVSRMKHLSQCGFNLLEPDEADEQMLDMIKFFVADLKSDIYAVDNLEKGVLHFVSNFNEVKLLMDFDIQKKLNFSSSVLLNMFARFKTSDSILLIEALKDVIGNANFEIEYGSLLHSLINANVSNEIIVKFMEYVDTAHIISQDTEGKSVLHCAVENDNIELVKILLGKYKANLYTQDNGGKSVLEYETTEPLAGLLKFQRMCCKFKPCIPSLPKIFVNFYKFDFEKIGSCTIVTGILGSGKSTFMSWLAFELSWSFIVVYINLVDLPDSFFNLKAPENLCGNWLITKLVESNCNDLTDKSKLIDLVESQKLHLAVFIDGIDELHDESTENVLSWLVKVKEVSGKLVISSEDINLLVSLRSSAQIYKIPNLETKDVFKMFANLSTQTFCFSEITPLDANMLSFIFSNTQCANILQKRHSRIDILEMLLLEKARNFYHKSEKSSGRRVDESAIERFCKTMKLAHLPLSLDVHYKSEQFPLIIDLIKNSYPTINSGHLVDFGIVERRNDALRFVHKAYSEYIIASFLCSIATSTSLSPYHEYCCQVANLFLMFLFKCTSIEDILLENSLDSLENLQTDPENRMLRYEILDSLLANKQYNSNFLLYIKKEVVKVVGTEAKNKQMFAKMIETKLGKYNQGIKKFLLALEESDASMSFFKTAL